MRIAIAGAVIGTAAGIGIGRDGPLVADLGHRSDGGGQAAAGRRPRPDADGHRYPRDHHRRAAGGGLAVARPDGLRPRRLVQLRPARHARQERRPDRPEAGRTLAVGDIMPTSPDSGLRGPRRSSPAARSSSIATRRSSSARPAAAAHVAVSRDVPAGLAASGAILRTDAAGLRRQLGVRRSSRSTAAGRGSSSASGSGSARPGPASGVVGPIMGFGVFVMMQRQMLGIRDRAERTAVAPPLRAPVGPSRRGAGQGQRPRRRRRRGRAGGASASARPAEPACAAGSMP